MMLVRSFAWGTIPALLLIVAACGQPKAPSENPKTIAVGEGPKTPTSPPLEREKPDKVEPGVAKPGPSDGNINIESKSGAGLDDSIPAQTIALTQTPEEKYNAALSDAFQLLADKKEEDALAKLQEAQAVQNTDFVKQEIERLKQLIARSNAAEKTVADIQLILKSGNAEEAAKLSAQALQQYGDSDSADELTQLKRQADALLAIQLEDQVRKQRYVDETLAAVKSKNLRAAVLAYEQALQNGYEDTEFKKQGEAIRTRLGTYDSNRNRANELRKDPYKLEEALVALKAAKDAWDTPQIQQELADTELALTNRRDRIAIGDFEVIGDIGVPLMGRQIAEEMLPHFKSRFDLVERSQLNNVLKELKLEVNALQTNERARAEFGTLSKARFMVVGSVSNLQGLTVHARLVDVRTGLIVQTGKLVATSNEELIRKLPVLARVLQMSDEQKIAYEADLARTAVVITPPTQVVIPPATQIVVEATPPPAIVIHSPRPPELGTVVLEDFNRFQPTSSTSVQVSISDAPGLYRDRALSVSVELGDNCFRRGQYRDAVRHFEFALTLAPDRRDLQLRIDRCRPHLPPPVVVVPILRPRLAILPFVEIGSRFEIPRGLGTIAADCIAPYFSGTYEVIDRGELYWWMGRLGLSVHDVLVNPGARLILARSLGVRHFLLGALQESNGGIWATTHLVDPEFNAQVATARLFAYSARELKLRLPELARLTLLPPQQRVEVVQVVPQYERKMEQAQIEYRKGKFSIAIGFYREALQLQPDSVHCRTLLVQAESRQRQFEVEESRRLAFEQQAAFAAVQREREFQLALAAEESRRRAEIEAARYAQEEQRRQEKLKEQAYLALVGQARNAVKTQQYQLAISYYESAYKMIQQNLILAELGQARALAAQQAQQIAVQQAAAQQVALQQQRQAELAAVQAQLAAEQQRRQERERNAQQQLANQANTEYQRLIDAAQRAQAKGNLDAQINALQAARRLKPSAELDQQINAALIEQAKFVAAKKGEKEKAELERQLALEKDRRQQAEAEAEKNRKLYEEAMVQAQQAMNAKNYEQAVVQYRTASLKVRTDDAMKGLQRAQDELAKVKTKADEEARAKLEEKKKEDNFQRLVKDGQAALAAKEFDKAITLFKAAREIKPTDANLQSQMVQAEQGKAQIRLQKEKETNTKAAQQLVQAAKNNLTNKQYEAAIASIRQALKLDPQNGEATKLLQEAETAQKQSMKDTAALAEAKKKQEQYEALMSKGRTALSLKNNEAALQSFKAAQQVLPGDQVSAQLIKEMEKQTSDAETARLTKMKEEQARQVTVLLERGRTALKANRLAEAETLFQQVSKLAPDNPELKKFQGEIDSAKQTAQANEKKQMEEKTKADKVKTLLAQAQQSIQAQKWDEATKALNEAQQLAPTDSTIKRMQQQLVEAKKQTEATAQEAKKMQEAYQLAMRTGQIALEQKKYQEANNAFNEALKNKPNDPAATKFLAQVKTAQENQAMEAKNKEAAYQQAIKNGQLALQAKKYDQAIQSFHEALKQNPTSKEVGDLLKQAQKLKADEDTVMAAEAAKKKQYDTLMLQGRTAMTNKKYKEALEAFTAALQVIPNDAAATKALTEARTELTKPSTPVPPKIEPLPKKEEPKKTDPVTIPKTNPTVPPKMEPKKEEPKIEPKKKEEPKIDPVKQAYKQQVEAGKLALVQKRYEDALKNFTTALQLVPNDPEATKLLNETRNLAKPATPVPPKIEPKAPPKIEPKMPAKVDPIPPKVEPKTQPKVEPKKVEPKKEEPKKIDPKVEQIKQLLQLGTQQEAQSKYGEALKTYQTALQLSPNDANIKKKVDFSKAMDAGIKELNAGKSAEAVLSFDVAVRLFPDDPNAKKYLNQAKTPPKKKQ